MITVAVDFDDTLVCYDDQGKMYPAPGARESLKRLKNLGCKVIIHTCRTTEARERGNLNEEISFIARTLEQFDFFYDDIFIGSKLIADIYVDDRAVSYNGDWKETTTECSKRINSILKKIS